MDLSIVIPFYNGHATIAGLLADIPSDLPVIVVDDHSDQPFEAPPGANLKNVMVIRPPEKGYFAGAVNAGIERAGASDVLVLNQDVRLEGSGWLDLLADMSQRYSMIGEAVRGNNRAYPGSYIHGTFMYLSREAITKVGPLNAHDFPLWGCTAEYQLRVFRAGLAALPLRRIPGFRHLRGERERYGSSIKALVNKRHDMRDWLIRIPPLVTVVVPCYNYGRYLPDAIASLIGGETSLGEMPGQTFQAFEAIIVDDASNDETAEIAEALADPWKGIFYARHFERRGTPAANNTGMKMAQGRAVTHLSADDMFEPWRLEVLYRAWESDPSKVYYDDVRQFGRGKRRETLPMQEYDFERLKFKNQMHAGIFFSRQAFQEVGGYPPEMIYGREDWAMNVRLGLAGYCGQRVPEAGYLYRREGQGRSTRNTGPDWRERFLAQMQGLFPEAYDRARYPKMCCGRNGNGNSQYRNMGDQTMARINQIQALAGGEGLTLLRYVGSSIGTSYWYGPVSGRRYAFGLSRPLGYVDNRDLNTGSAGSPGLLEMREAGQRLFTVETPAPEKITQELARAGASVNQGVIEPGHGEVAADDAFDPLAGPAREVVDWFLEHDLSEAEREAYYEAEKAGRNRKTVLSAILGD